MAQAKRPSSELKDKKNVNPSLIRKNEAVDLDFHDIYETLFDHAEKIDGFTGGNSSNVFYGFHSSLELLIGFYPEVEEDSFAIIEGITPQIAQFKNGEWIKTGGNAPFVFVDTRFDRPDVGTEKTWYIVRDSNTAWLWYDEKYHEFVMPDLSNYYTKYEIDSEISDIITAADNLADTVAEAELDIQFLKENTIKGIRDSEGNLIAPNAQREVTLPELNDKRTISSKNNTSQFTASESNFSKDLLEFTANSGEVISVIINKDLVTSGGLQAISTGNNQLKPVAGTDVTFIYPEGAGDKTVPKGILSILATGTPNVYKVDGSLEALENNSQAYSGWRITANGVDYDTIEDNHSIKFQGTNNIITQYNAETNTLIISGFNLAPKNHTHDYDNYAHWKLGIGDGTYQSITSTNGFNIVAGTGVTVSRDGSTITISASGGGTASSVDWSDVTGKPTTFSPSSHNHSASQITSGVFASSRLPKLVTDVTINQINGNLIVSYSDGTSVERSFGTIEATKFTQ